ncbi:unnamed protein product [Rotaria sp. Silwood1]|nr:unnamed protein product [Rotaria sp. Silwood1]CAF5113053.1 unnamed protein product [Rotaria sp. Silwood1]
MNINKIVIFLQKTILVAFIAVSFYATAQPPAGYYNNATGKTCAALKTALRGIVNNGINFRAYGDLKTQNVTYEIKPRTVGTGSANVIYDIYSTIPNGTDPYQFTPATTECGNYNGEGDCYNREHSVPQSWFGGGTTPGPGTDFLHIYPTDGYVNGKRGNQPYGEVSNPSWTSLNGSKYGQSSLAGITDKNGKYAYSEVFTIHIPLNTKFAVYPNPAGNFINVQLNDYSITSSQMTITDMAGKVVLQKNIAVQNGLAITDASSLSNGTYFIQLKTHNEILTSKLVILK